MRYHLEGLKKMVMSLSQRCWTYRRRRPGFEGWSKDQQVHQRSIQEEEERMADSQEMDIEQGEEQEGSGR